MTLSPQSVRRRFLTFALIAEMTSSVTSRYPRDPVVGWNGKLKEMLMPYVSVTGNGVPVTGVAVTTILSV